MEVSLGWKFDRHLYTTPIISTRDVYIQARTIFKSQNRTHSTWTLNPSMLEFTPQSLESHALCQSYVWDKLVGIGIDRYYCNQFSLPIASYAIATSCLAGDGVGFYFIANLEIIFDYSSGIPTYDDNDMVVQPRGASKSVIDRLIRTGRLNGGTTDEVKGTCPVCLEDFVPQTTEELLRMPCSHLFHDHCIIPWLERNDSCPMCRKATV